MSNLGSTFGCFFNEVRFIISHTMDKFVTKLNVNKCYKAYSLHEMLPYTVTYINIYYFFLTKMVNSFQKLKGFA